VKELTEENVLAIQDFCNDTMMKLYRIHKKAEWAKDLNDHQLCGVFTCIAEDSVARSEKFECHELDAFLKTI